MRDDDFQKSTFGQTWGDVNGWNDLDSGTVVYVGYMRSSTYAAWNSP
jgi:hypothetical protein